jgi:hypothetical protein
MDRVFGRDNSRRASTDGVFGRDNIRFPFEVLTIYKIDYA